MGNRHDTPEDWPRAHCLADKHRRQTWGTEALGGAVPDLRPALAQHHPSSAGNMGFGAEGTHLTLGWAVSSPPLGTPVLFLCPGDRGQEWCRRPVARP